MKIIDEISQVAPASREARRSRRVAILSIPLLALALIAAGCSDDDDPPSGGDSVTMGTVVQTFTSSQPIQSEDSSLVVNIIDTGAPAPAPTGGMLAPRGGGVGNASNGLLVISSDVRVLLSGTYDPASGRINLSNAGGTTVDGVSSPSSLIGSLTVPDIDQVEVDGLSSVQDGPLLDLLGAWEIETSTIDATCSGVVGTVPTIECTGYLRARLAGTDVVLDGFESCGGEPSICELREIDFDDGMWNGNSFATTEVKPRTLVGCNVQFNGAFNLNVSSNALDTTFSGPISLTGSSCEVPPGTPCTAVFTRTAKLCTSCWPNTCAAPF